MLMFMEDAEFNMTWVCVILRPLK